MIIPVEYYKAFYLFFTTVFTIIYSCTFFTNDCRLVYQKSNSIYVFVYILLFTLIVGYRPNWVWFGDSVVYVNMYNNFYVNGCLPNPESKEWIFENMMYYSSKIMDYRGFFFIVECLYIFPVLWTCRKLIPNHYLFFFIICMGTFSFYSYSYNGIRNGMACSLIIAALGCINGKIISKIIAGILCFAAFNIHRSTALPIICMVTSYYVKNTRYFMWWWLFSIVLSLVAGGTIESFFTGLGFDDRLSSYAIDDSADAMFSSTGFRWDFLLYSAMPIVLGYYVVFIRKIWDKNYLMLLNTYILCNSFWVMMIRASYSNRFAYLSWFMYALVLAYPCLKLPVWKNQGANTALIFMGHLGFTLFMYWFI